MSEIDDILKQDDLSEILDDIYKHKDIVNNFIIGYTSQGKFHWHGLGPSTSLIGIVESIKAQLLRELKDLE